MKVIQKRSNQKRYLSESLNLYGLNIYSIFFVGKMALLLVVKL